MNPPYNIGDGGPCKKNKKQKRDTMLGSKIMKSLENHRVVCISNYASLSGQITKLTSVERVVFPGILCSTWIWTMNDKKEILYPIVHKLKIIKKSDYFFLKMGNGSLYQLRKTNKSELNRVYVDVKNDDEMNEINVFIKNNWEKYSIFVPTMTWHPWIIANILYNSPWRERFVK
jgi:hypothetical protein